MKEGEDFLFEKSLTRGLLIFPLPPISLNDLTNVKCIVFTDKIRRGLTRRPSHLDYQLVIILKFPPLLPGRVW